MCNVRIHVMVARLLVFAIIQQAAQQKKDVLEKVNSEE